MQTTERYNRLYQLTDGNTTRPPLKSEVFFKKTFFCNVDKLNDFMQEWITQHFKFNMHSGWKFKTQENKKAMNDLKKS